MNLTVSGHHLRVTPAIRRYLQGKLERILRHFDHVIEINVILSVNRLTQKAEASCRVRGKDIFVESAAEDLYAAIDQLADKLDRRVLRHKGRARPRPQTSSGARPAGGGSE